MQVATRNCIAEAYFDVKRFLERDQRSFRNILSEINLGNVDMWQLQVQICLNNCEG